jgi:foldase protein PrsA
VSIRYLPREESSNVTSSQTRFRAPPARQPAVRLIVFVVAVCALALAGCGGGGAASTSTIGVPGNVPSHGPLPGGVVAEVQGAPVTAASVRHWMGIAYNQLDPSPDHQLLPAPPTYATCVAALRTLPGPGSRWPERVLRAQCAHSYAMARSDAVSFLVKAQWLSQEGNTQHVRISSSAVSSAVAQAITQQHPGPGVFQQFLAKTGMSKADFSLSVRLNAIGEALQKKYTMAAVSVTPGQVARYYRTHLSQYAIPPSRLTLMVVTGNMGSALKAKAALRSGQGWRAVAKRYSVDSSKIVGGAFAVVPGEQDPRLVHAAFSAARGRIEGPVRVPQSSGFGGGSLYYVFKVTGGDAGSQQPLAKVASQIRQTLTEQLRQRSIGSFMSAYEKRWKARTRCRPGYVVQACGDAGAAPAITPPR